MSTDQLELDPPQPAEPLTSPGNCVVCGKSTMLRCTDCAKYGIGYMFFCGIEHKKLVYSVHRRVCGIRSNPLQWPGLSIEEYHHSEEVKRNVEERGQKFGADSIAWEHLSSCRDPPKSERMSSGSNKWLIRIRRDLFQQSLNEARALLPQPAGAEMYYSCSQVLPIDSAIWQEEKVHPGLASNDPPLPWYTMWHHKVLIKEAVKIYYLNSAPRSPQHREVQAYFEYVAKDLREFCRKTISVTHPRVAELLMKTIEGSLADAPNQGHEARGKGKR
ncbi:hypothetical protein JCM5350_007279 [Sporobolomyces pararoseus]